MREGGDIIGSKSHAEVWLNMHAETLDWFEQVPKVELHLHLEGAIPLEALWELILKYGGDTSVPNLEALKRRFTYQSFPQFIETWIWKNQYLREYADFALLAEAVARDLARQNIRYVEAFYSPSDFEQHGLQAQRLTEAIRLYRKHQYKITDNYGPYVGIETSICMKKIIV